MSVEGVGCFGRDAVTLMVQMDFGDALDPNRRKGAEADMKGDSGDLNARSGNAIEHLWREVQAGSGRGDGSAFA